MAEANLENNMNKKRLVEAINNVSSRLAVINETVKKLSDSKKQDVTFEENNIHDLIVKIDNLFKEEDKNRFKPKKEMYYLLLAVLTVIAASAVLAILISLFKGPSEPMEAASLGASVTAVIIAYIAFIKQDRMAKVTFSEKVDSRCDLLINNDTSPMENILIRALIMIRTKNESLSLSELYSVNREMFAMNKLVERVYS
jgi:hypothetical protein